MYEHHLIFINGIYNVYSLKCECDKCGKLFTQISKCERHRHSCKESTQYKYPGRYFKYPQTLFDEIAELGININNRDKYYPYFAVYDFEALLSPVDQRSSEKLLWVNEHVPISVYLVLIYQSVL